MVSSNLIPLAQTGIDIGITAANNAIGAAAVAVPLPVMTILPSGNVGIGTISPVRAFHVTTAGSTEMISESSGVAAATVGRIWRSRLNPADATFTFDALNSDLSVGVSLLTMKPNGNVGIGTSVPLAAVQISDGNAVEPTLVNADKHLITQQASAAGNTIVVAGNTSFHRGVFKGTRARGTLAAPTAPNTDDLVLSFLGSIYDGATSQGTAAVDFYVDGAVSAGVAPQRISFVTSETNGTSRTEKMTIKANGNVGIGTTSPSSSLSVEKNQDSSTFVSVTNNSTGVSARGGFSFASDAASGGLLATGSNYTGIAGWADAVSLIANSDASGGLILSSANGISLRTTASSSTSGLSVVSGNVGVGTTSPNISGASGNFQAVSIVGPVGGILELGGATNTASAGSSIGQMYFFNGTVKSAEIGSWTNGTDSGTLRFLTKPAGSAIAERMHIDPNGNVGIGTTSPGTKLDVTGTVRASSQVTAGGSAGYLTMVSGDASNSGYLAWYRPDSVTRIGYMGWGTSGANNLNLTLENSASFAINGGNVGVGTTAPTTTLDVKGYITSSADGITSGLWLKPQDGTSAYTNTADEKNLIFGTTGMSGGDTTLGYKMSWRNADGSYRKDSMILHKDGHIYFPGGNVGVGTTSPDGKLRVVDSTGASQVRFGIDASGGGSLVSVAANNALFAAGADYDGTNWVARSTSSSIMGLNAGSTYFYGDTGLTSGNTFTPTQRMILNSSGNVGIGTTNPNTSLEIKADNSFPFRIDRNNASSRKAFIDFAQQGTKTFGIGVDQGGLNAQNFSIWDYVSGASRLIINGSGNVGIGTSVPSDLLTLTKSDTAAYSTASAAVIKPTLTGAGATFILNNSADQDLSASYILMNAKATDTFTRSTYIANIAEPTSNGTLAFGGRVGATSYAERMRINMTTGYVGIGASSPLRTLHVTGAKVTSGDSATQFRIQDTSAYNASPGMGIHFRGDLQ